MKADRTVIDFSKIFYSGIDFAFSIKTFRKGKVREVLLKSGTAPINPTPNQKQNNNHQI